MIRRASILGVASALLGLSVASVQAKVVHYDINGQRFAYSTNNRAEVQLARQRISAAQAAAAARAKADAELAANPLARVFESPSQKEAKAAEAHLAGILADAPSTPEPPQGKKSSTRADRPEHTATSTSPKPSKREPVRQARDAGVTTGSVHQKEARSPRPEPSPNKPTSSPKVESIVFDFASGIKTVFRADGTVQEGLFEPAEAEKLKRRSRSGGPEISFVNREVKAKVSAISRN